MQVDQKALEVLSASHIVGNHLTLPTQLERSLYERVSKVLLASGWTWSKKEKAHICEGDGVDVLEQVLLTGEVADAINAKKEFQFFETPEDLADQLVELAEIGDQSDVADPRERLRVSEPSAGTGRIVKALLKTGAVIFANEIQEDKAKLVDGLLYPQGSCTRMDFLRIAPPAPNERVIDRVVMNPPFSRQQDILHVIHAARFVKPGGKVVAVMGAGVTFRMDKRARGFREYLDAHRAVIKELPAGTFKESGTMVKAVVVSFRVPS